ncbi:MAG: homoserine O-acetyltransferase [Spirochaetae bacterium HGW-Spirochaetae-1]|jgi:homoserine O-acetyltransferase|nr:MAG: homoserine O-acetyltransferase [Spirochaetae bacterium HGW-Spirochaetae-1]
MTKKPIKTYHSGAGLVETKYFTFAEPPHELVLQSGKKLGPITLAYETYGELNRDRSNAILVFHALSGTAHAAGYHTPDDQYPGWWDIYIGPGKAFDTNKYFVICSNVIGGCNGSTGPSSINPETGNPFGLDFPMVTIEDMVQAQYHLIRHLGIEKLLSVAGGSMGGMQALSWSIQYPDKTNSVIAIATSALLSAQGIAFNEVGRQAIINDRNWSGGNYYSAWPPDAGLGLARMIGHITYLSEKHMHERFGRRFQEINPDTYSFKTEYMVESYLHHQGIKFVDRFDANSYLYITRAIDLFDLNASHDGSLIKAFENAKSNFLVVSFTSDWLYPSPMSKEIVRALRANGKNVIYTDIDTDMGHDSFLLENSALEKYIANFLKSEYGKIWLDNGTVQ